MSIKQHITAAILAATVSTGALANNNEQPKPQPQPQPTTEINNGAAAGAAAAAQAGAVNKNDIAVGQQTAVKTNVDVTNTAQGGQGGVGQGGNAVTGDQANTQTATQTNNVQGSTVQGGDVNIGGDNVKVGAITGAPGMASVNVASECQTGWGLSLGGGTPYNGSGGVGFNKVSKDDDCIVKGREHRERIQQMANEGAATVANIQATAAVKIKRIEGATEVAVTGLTHACNLAVVPSVKDTIALRGKGASGQSTGHEHCEQSMERAVDYLFEDEVEEKPVAAAPSAVAPAAAAPAPAP